MDEAKKVKPIKINFFIFGTLGILYAIALWLLYLVWKLPKETLAFSWLITGEVTDIMTKQDLILRFCVFYTFLLGFLIFFSILALRSNKEYIVFRGKYNVTYKIRRENVPNFLGLLTLLGAFSLDGYLFDVLEFNKTGKFYFFNFPFIIIYVIVLFTLFFVGIWKYGK